MASLNQVVVDLFAGFAEYEAFKAGSPLNVPIALPFSFEFPVPNFGAVQVAVSPTGVTVQKVPTPAAETATAETHEAT